MSIISNLSQHGLTLHEASVVFDILKDQYFYQLNYRTKIDYLPDGRGYVKIHPSPRLMESTRRFRQIHAPGIKAWLWRFWKTIFQDAPNYGYKTIEETYVPEIPYHGTNITSLELEVQVCYVKTEYIQIVMRCAYNALNDILYIHPQDFSRTKFRNLSKQT